MYFYFSLLLLLIESGSAIVFLNSALISKHKITVKNTIVKLVIFFIAAFIISAVFDNTTMYNSLVRVICNYIFILCYSMIFYSDYIEVKSIISLILYILIYVIDYAVAIIAIFLIPIANKYILMCLSKIILAAIVAVVAFTCKRRIYKEPRLSFSAWGTMVALFLSSFFPIVFLYQELSVGAFINNYIILMSISLLIINFTAVCISWIFLRRIQQVHLQESQYLYMQKSIESFKETTQNAQRFRQVAHDINNHFIYVVQLLKDNQICRSIEYIESISTMATYSPIIVNTNNSCIDALLSNKLSLARSKNIDMVFAISDLASLNIPDEDIIALLGNIVDNAIEACDLLPDNRIIDVKILINDDWIILSTQNPLLSTKCKESLFSTSKADKLFHGVGLRCVREIVSKYNAEFVMDTKDGFVYATVMLPKHT